MMTRSGETIDYGPCAFMDTYDPGAVFSSIDRMGRYAYANQPAIAQWNLARLAETLLPLLDDDAEQIAVAVAQRLQGGVLLQMVRHVGKQDLVDDDATHGQADDHTQTEDVTHGRGGVPVFDLAPDELRVAHN